MTTEYNAIDHKGIAIDETTPEVTIARPRKKQLTTVSAAPKKKSLFTRTVNSLVSPEDAQSLQEVLVQEVLLPAVKSIILDMVTTGITTALYGKGSSTPRNASRNYSRTDYTQNYQSVRKPNTQPKPTMGRAKNYDHGNDGRSYVNEYVVANRHEALMILDELRSSISMYGSVSVSDYYDYIGHESAYTDLNYGWTNLERVPITATRGGFVLNLPPVETI